MGISAELRATVRAAFGGRCGYCGVSETSVGGELEIDHFRPVAAGGSDAPENLVYACTPCNRFKGDYAPAEGGPEGLRLLHPLRDDMGAHIVETAQGALLGITPRGWFHVRRIQLNRSLLIEARRTLRFEQIQKDDLARARLAADRLRRENTLLQGEVSRLRAVITELLRRGNR